jgi:hypothetical protein
MVEESVKDIPEDLEMPTSGIVFPFLFCPFLFLRMFNVITD